MGGPGPNAARGETLFPCWLALNPTEPPVNGYQLVLLVSSGHCTDHIVAIRTEVVLGLVLYICHPLSSIMA